MSATSTKKKPLIFKRRAGPVSTAPIAALDSDSDSDLSSVQRPANVTAAGRTEGSGVDLFRRAKQFFPRAIEEQNQRMLAEAHRKQQSPADAPDRTPVSTPDPEDHGPKRRKVSYETAGSDCDDSCDQQQKAKPSSKTSTNPSPAPSSLRGSPPLRARNKGKGVATPHTVNSHVIFSRVTATDAADDSLVLLDNEDGYDERTAIDAAIAQIKAEESTEPLLEQFRAEPKNTIVYEVEDDDDEEGDINGNGNVKGGENDDDYLVEAANPEFNEYILQARARDAAARAAQAVREAARIGKTPRGGSTATTTTTSGTGTANASQSVADSLSPGSTPASPGTLPSCAQNYRIFVTPHLPEPVPPLIAMVRMDQRMEFVQAAFLSHARKKGVHLSDEAAAGVVLTWKGIKIFSWTTGHLLDIHPDAHGKFRDDGCLSGSRTGASRQPAGFVSGGLHLEIWTQELYDAYLRDQERRRLRKLGEAVDLDLDLDSSSSSNGGGRRNSSTSSNEDRDNGAAEIGSGGVHKGRGGGSGTGGQPAAASSQRIRLVLKSRDHEKLNMTVYADTKVETLITAFREQRNIASEQTIAIHWDGERLDENSTVEDAEMEDMDSVEVFIH